MELYSFDFFLFLFFVAAVFYFFPSGQRIILLCGSLLFVLARNPASLLILLALTIFNYYTGRHLSKAKSLRQLLFYSGLAINIVAFFLIRYSPMFAGDALPGAFHTGGEVYILGISFYSLQNIAYLVSMYSGQNDSRASLIDYAIYSNYFPKVTSGPLTPVDSFIDRLREKILFRKENIITGINRMALGIFKKIVLADRLSMAAPLLFDQDGHYSGITVFAAICLFAFRIYFDFSAYTDIAIGASRLFGIELKENFRYPFRASSVADFWRRWHISLYDWLREYVYLPVAFSLRQFGMLAVIAGIGVTVLISGIWHGAGLTFIAYAGMNILYLVTELATKNIKGKLSEYMYPRIYKGLGIFFTFSAVCLSFIFFRSSSWVIAKTRMTQILSVHDFFPESPVGGFIAPLAGGGDLESQFNFYVSVLLATLFFIIETKADNIARSAEVRWGYFVLVFLSVLLFGVLDKGHHFIYNQF